MTKLKIKSWRIVIYSFVAIGFVVFAFITKNWLFVLGAVVLMMLNQYELSKAKKKQKENA